MKDEEFQKRSSHLLQAGADRLDAHIRSRLTQARFAAVEAARRSRARRAWRVWAPAGGLAAAVVLAVILWGGRPAPHDLRVANLPADAGLAGRSPIDDLELLATNESFELLEDLEFYEWLDSAPQTDAGVG